MIKKINKYLLENHPLIWNTRFIWMLIALLFAHLGFFAMGFFSYRQPVELHDYNFFDRYFDDGYVWIGILLAILILILWLNQYLKHNAFKSFYPKSGFSLYKEFLIIFIIAALSVGTYFSFTYGLKTRVSSIKTLEELQNDVDLVNQVAPFTLQSVNYREYTDIYSSINRCVDAPVFDSLVSFNEVLERVVYNNYYNNYWDISYEDTRNYQKYKDSLKLPLYKEAEFDEILIQKLPQRENWVQPKEEKAKEPVEDDVIYSGEDATYATTAYTEDISPYDNLKSIYNHCHVLIDPTDSLKNNVYYTEKTQKLLSGNKKEEIQTLLNNYLKLADEYQIGYRFKDKNWIDYVYNPPYYFVNYELSTSEEYSQYYTKSFKKDYISENDLQKAVETLLKSKTNIFEPVFFLFWLYFSLGLALLIFTFKVTSTRTWVIAVIGAIILTLLFSSIFYFLTLFRVFTHEFSVSSLLLVFISLFWIFSLFGIWSKKRKTISGVNLIWKIWTFAGIAPILVGIYMIYLQQDILYNYEYNPFIHPHAKWIEDHIVELLFANLVLFLIYLLLITPIIKKWKAIPEE